MEIGTMLGAGKLGPTSECKDEPDRYDKGLALKIFHGGVIWSIAARTSS